MVKKGKDEISEKISGKKEVSTYFANMRRNADRLKKERGYKLKDIVEKSELKEETVNSFFYDMSLSDCRLSTAAGIAKSFGVTIAEMAETETIEPRLLENMKAYRELPESSKSFVDFIISQVKFMHENHKSQRVVNMMIPECNNNGNLKKTNIYEPLNVDNIGSEDLHRVFMAIKIPCNHYLPYYMKNDIILIANDRDAFQNEKSVIIVNDNLIITRRVIENGKPKYYGIRDNVLHSEDDDRIYVLGYIVKVISE